MCGWPWCMFYVLCSANEQLIECVFLWHDGLSFQNHMAQRHHLSKALVVSLMKSHYFKRAFAKGEGRMQAGSAPFPA